MAALFTAEHGRAFAKYFTPPFLKFFISVGFVSSLQFLTLFLVFRIWC